MYNNSLHWLGHEKGRNIKKCMAVYGNNMISWLFLCKKNIVRAKAPQKVYICTRDEEANNWWGFQKKWWNVKRRWAKNMRKYTKKNRQCGNHNVVNNSAAATQFLYEKKTKNCLPFVIILIGGWLLRVNNRLITGTRFNLRIS